MPLPLRMEPGMIYKTWADFKEALDTHCEENKCLFNISNAKTVDNANLALKKKPLFDIKLKYASCILVCKHYGSYNSLSSGLRPNQRTYKENCKAYINISASRKENYLIIRDSCHLHSHPCTSEVYASYPEIRRMTHDEKKIVGTLMKCGVPHSHIINAVRRNITHKDLQNARQEVKSGKLSLKMDEEMGESKPGGSASDQLSCELISDHDELQEGRLDKDELNLSSSSLKDLVSSVNGDVNQGSYIVTVSKEADDLEIGALESTVSQTHCDDNEAEVNRDETSAVSINTSGLSGLLAAAGIDSESVVLAMNASDGRVKEEVEVPQTVNTSNAYTVTVCLPSGDVNKKGNNLQELLKGLPLGKIISKPSSTITASMQARPTQTETHQTEEFSENHKLCIQCRGYISPLDGHDSCLQCLGPEHIHEEDCLHCKNMLPEQVTIRRKKMVAIRMKALKELRKKQKLEEEVVHHQIQKQTNQLSDSDSDSGSNLLRKSKRRRKQKSFGPDFSVESSIIKNVVTHTSSGTSVGKTKDTDTNTYDVENDIKKEPEFDVFDRCDEEEQLDHVFNFADKSNTNSERFTHILSQTSVFEDVKLVDSDGVLLYAPGEEDANMFKIKTVDSDLPAIPINVKDKYQLDPNFESELSAIPEAVLSPCSSLSHPGLEMMDKGLIKLAKNAATHARLAVYDKLFTRLGMSMADEALSILSELHGKVSQVTEISQEDLTSNLQTALDTIQALKDVLEELGVMSKDAALTAAHQRSISINSLSNAKNLLKPKTVSRVSLSSRRAKFTPFSLKKLGNNSKNVHAFNTTLPVDHTSHIQTSLDKEFLTKHEALQNSSPEPVSTTQDDAETNAINISTETTPVSQMSEAAGMSIHTITGPQSSTEATSEPESSFINMGGKLYSVPPLTISSELLSTLNSSKEGIIEHVTWE